MRALRSILGRSEPQKPEEPETEFEREVKALSDEDLNRRHQELTVRIFAKNPDEADAAAAREQYPVTAAEIQRRIARIPDDVLEAYHQHSDNPTSPGAPSLPWSFGALEEERVRRSLRQEETARSERRTAKRKEIAGRSDADLKAEIKMHENVLAKYPGDSHSHRAVIDLTQELEGREFRRRQQADWRDIVRTRVARRALHVSRTSLAVSLVSLAIAIIALVIKAKP
jgi:hypothetical protein